MIVDAPPNKCRDQDREQEVDVENIARRDRSQIVHIQRAADAGNERTEHEGEQFQLGGVRGPLLLTASSSMLNGTQGGAQSGSHR